MAQHVLILDNELLRVISAGRCHLNNKQLSQIDSKMRRAGFFWNNAKKIYFRLYFNAPPIRRRKE